MTPHAEQGPLPIAARESRSNMDIRRLALLFRAVVLDPGHAQVRCAPSNLSALQVSFRLTGLTEVEIPCGRIYMLLA